MTDWEEGKVGRVWGVGSGGGGVTWREVSLVVRRMKKSRKIRQESKVVVLYPSRG